MSWGYPTKVPQTGQLKTREIYTLPFLGLDFAGLPSLLRLQGRVPPASPSFWGLQASWACSHIMVVSTSVFMLSLPMCLCPYFPVLIRTAVIALGPSYSTVTPS